MKIEKINENQIRCTLTREDLAQRQIRISELAYGSEKAKSLFRDMMQQAFHDCGFEVDNTPLMIEAVPLSSDSLILIITKVEDPEELDSRFARFSPEEGADSSLNPEEILTGADDVLDLISRLTRAMKTSTAAKKQSDGQPLAAAKANQPAAGQEETGERDEVFLLTKFYLFRDLETIIRAAHVLDREYEGPNSLFKNPEDGNYFLILRKADTPAALFNKVCNVLSEYALQADYLSGMEEYFTEHLKVIVKGDALQRLRQI